jgi:hypothetical protein
LSCKYTAYCFKICLKQIFLFALTFNYLKNCKGLQK